jgi:hypothetical protein
MRVPPSESPASTTVAVPWRNEYDLCAPGWTPAADAASSLYARIALRKDNLMLMIGRLAVAASFFFTGRTMRVLDFQGTIDGPS